MTASGITHVQTPIAGLVDLALRDPSLQEVAAAPPTDPSISPSSDRPAPGCTWRARSPQAGPLLVVTATGREADDLTAELRGVLGDAVALFPSWETLPHERLSPGRRHRRRAHDAAAPAGPPGRRRASARRCGSS